MRFNFYVFIDCKMFLFIVVIICIVSSQILIILRGQILFLRKGYEWYISIYSRYEWDIK